MAEYTTIARPYARAAFETAQEAGDFKKWSEMLDLLAGAVETEALRAAIGSPRVTPSQVCEILLELGGDRFDEAGRNFVRVLAEGRRLFAVPRIRELYEQHRAEAEGEIDVEIRSAKEPSAEQRKRIEQALKKRLNRDVSLHVVTDSDLLGGAVIRAGDLVIDGSVRTKLNRLADAMSQ